MKKFYSFLVAAVALVGFAACSVNGVEEIAPVENMTLTASFDNTRTMLHDGVKVKWDALDKITVTNGTDYVTYSVTHLSEDSSSAVFEGAKLEGNLYAYYPASNDIRFENGVWVGAATKSEQSAVKGTFASNTAISTAVCDDGEHLYFQNQCAVLKFQVPQMVVNSANAVEFFNGDQSVVKVSGKMSVGNDYFAVVMPGTYTFTVNINGLLSKESTKALELEKNTIYNLGTLPAPNEFGDNVYLVAGMWDEANAWFAAHFYNDANDVFDTKMTPTQTAGVYQCRVPLGMTKVIFCRVNPATTTFDWSMVWDQTGNETIGVAPANYYYITDWKVGEWHEAGYEVTPSAPQYALAGSFNNWGDLQMTNEDGIYSAKGVVMAADAKFKVKRAGSWDENYGASDILDMKPNHHIFVASNGSDITMTEAGTYDVYFDLEALKLYVVTAGADYTQAPQQMPEVTANVVYLKPNSNWKVDNARFAAYFWNNKGSIWVNAADTDGDGIYEIHLPEGYDYGCNVIFCRMNPNKPANGWDSKWNQTSDLVVPTDGKNLYTIAEGAWDNGEGSWSKM